MKRPREKDYFEFIGNQRIADYEKSDNYIDALNDYIDYLNDLNRFKSALGWIEGKARNIYSYTIGYILFVRMLFRMRK